MIQNSFERDFRISAFFEGKWDREFAMRIAEALEPSSWDDGFTYSALFSGQGDLVSFESFDLALHALTSSPRISIYQRSKKEPNRVLRLGHDETGMGLRLSGGLQSGVEVEIQTIFTRLCSVALSNPNLQSLTIVTLPIDNHGLDDIHIPTCVAPFHVHCYKAAYRRDYYTQFMSREDMLRLPAYKVTEREDGAVVTQIYPDMMAGESAEALDFMERCAWHFDKYHRVYGSTIYTLPEEWAEGGFFYRQERRLFGPNGLDGVVPQDLGLL